MLAFGRGGAAFGQDPYVTNRNVSEIWRIKSNGTHELFVEGLSSGAFRGTASFAFSPYGKSMFIANGIADKIYRVTAEVKTPQEQIQELIVQLVNLNLQHGIENSLDAKHDSAIQSLDFMNQNSVGATAASLEAFINVVEAQGGQHIPVADANTLISTAQQIIAVMQGGFSFYTKILDPKHARN